MSLNIKKRPFYVLDLDEYIVAEYSSKEKCAKEMKLQLSKISDCLTGIKESHGEYRFKYKYQSDLWLKHISCSECGHEKANFNITNCPHKFKLICSKCKNTKNLKVVIGEGVHGTAKQVYDSNKNTIISMPEEPFFYNDKDREVLDQFDSDLQEDIILDAENEAERQAELSDLESNDDLSTLEWSDEESRWI